MIPTQPPTTNASSAAKRKTTEDGDMFNKASKKARNDTAGIPNVNLKRKQPGEEKIGGLVIKRGPPTRPQPSQDTQPPLSRASPFETERSTNAGPSASKPPSKVSSKPSTTKSTAGPAFARIRKKGKDRDVSAEGGGEREVEEDVRQMNTEADDLRDRSRASMASMTPAALRVDFQFPPSNPPNPSAGKSRVRQLQEQAGAAPVNGGAFGTPPPQTARDTMMPIVEQETPQIKKNKLFRGESMQRPAPIDFGKPPSNVSGSGPSSEESSGHSRRRSSLSMRGKRSSSSFESTGIITRPHTSVSDTSLYKHIDPDLPESQRVRQLLIWVSSRAMDPPSSSSRTRGRKSIVGQVPPEPQLPPLPSGGAELLKEIKADLVRQLAEKKIDTSAYSGPPEVNGSAWKLRENEQNVKNRAREKLFTEQIEERKKEDVAWAEVAQFYNAHQTNVLSSLNQRKSLSAKAKGKQRATSQEPEALEPWENELPDVFRGSKGFDVAKQLLEVGIESVGKGDSRLEELQYKEDRLHAAISVAHQLTQITASELDHRFSLLSISLAQRTLPPANPSSLRNPNALSNFVPVISLPSARHPGPDPQDLLRAISRTDAARPRSQLGDAARRAAKDVQRANETQAQAASEGGLMVERRLTDVPPPTPRKPPGTPKRPSTPGTARR
ncbi:Mis12-Mtw1 protein family-domain-containing protein [Phellopilus nigrolimitatus]|nr:Mis12-Mtw1 protein family-domain-containing protein [Phellopilus nigrolimitatus]